MPASLHKIGYSGLFDVAFYLSRNPDLEHLGSGALAHYHREGWRDGRWPNSYFDPRWYLQCNRDVTGDPLLHYLTTGEREGRRPIAWFDPVWYRNAHRVPEGTLALAHYLANRHRADIRPLPEFDTAFYLSAYPDVAASGIDPVEHYMMQGFREIRRPFAEFDPLFYRARYLRHLPDANPFLHYLEHRDRPGIYPCLPPGQATIPREVRRRTLPGPDFEETQPLPECAVRRARVLAYYLPQFHATAANDAWWGRGFTEWTNVARALPRFAEHYQPRTPRDLGHYTLDDPDILARQAKMAHDAGIDGFVFYFYWFDGQRLLDSPLEMLLAHPEIDMPFCLMWANENWSRRWDGGDEDVLIAQTYRREDDRALVACFARHMRDPRYIHVDSRPLLMIYRPGAIPDGRASIARWRALFRDEHDLDPIFVMGQAFGDFDPRPFGMEGAIEFPPHKVVENAQLINERLDILDDDFNAQVYDYADIVENALRQPAPQYPLIRTAAPSWDNDARRQGKGLVLHGSTPALYEKWLKGLVDQARDHLFFKEPIVCVNAWNEWAEGAYLEPDQHFGSAYLNATARAVTGFEARHGNTGILLVGHDAFPSGAQLLLLEIGARLRRQHGARIMFVLLEAGHLLERYRAVAPVEILPPGETATWHRLASLRREGFTTALVNSVASSPLAEDLHRAGIHFSLLQHELQGIIRQRGLSQHFAHATKLAREIVIPSEALQNTASSLCDTPDTAATRILPQGLYTPVSYSSAQRREMRAHLGLSDRTPLAVGAGYADMRKGFDLFLHLWRMSRTPSGCADNDPMHFIWVGAIDPAMKEGLQQDIERALASGSFHMPGHTDSITPYLAAADVFVLTSREDPYPSVVLEALSCGLPCVAFDGTGGIPSLLHTIAATHPSCQAVVPAGHLHDMSDAVGHLAGTALLRPEKTRQDLGRTMARRFDFGRYVSTLLTVACPSLPRISVVVLSYNYAHYLAARLSSIFAQKTPVFEIIVLDDASSDDSANLAARISDEHRRNIRIVRGRKPSGSVFRQWMKAATLAKGDWVWIAEADDLVEPDFLDALVNAIRQTPDAVMAFCDSRTIDGAGVPLASSYRSYYEQSVGHALDSDLVQEGSAFVRTCLSERNLVLNASSALFRRDALLPAMKRCGKVLHTMKVAGDWRLYVELLDRPDARIAYVAKPLNIHRRHAQSATHSLDLQNHLAEIASVQDEVAQRFDHPAEMLERQHAYRRTLIRHFNLMPQKSGNDAASAFPQARHQFDEVARNMATIELETQNIVPAVLDGSA